MYDGKTSLWLRSFPPTLSMQKSRGRKGSPSSVNSYPEPATRRERIQASSPSLPALVPPQRNAVDMALVGSPPPCGAPGRWPECNLRYCRGCGDRLRWRRDAGPHLVARRVHGSAAVCLPGESGVHRPRDPQSPASHAPLGLGWTRAGEPGIHDRKWMSWGLEEANNSQQHSKPPRRAASREQLSAPLPSTGTAPPKTGFPESIAFPSSFPVTRSKLEPLLSALLFCPASFLLFLSLCSAPFLVLLFLPLSLSYPPTLLRLPTPLMRGLPSSLPTGLQQ